MGSFDIFFDAADHTSVAQTRTQGNTSGVQVLNSEGWNFLLSGAPAVPFAEGMRVLVFDNISGLAYGTVRAVPDSTHVTVLPIRSALDTVTLPFSFANGSLITVVEESAAQQIIDLSEAPGDAYDFLMIGCSSVESSGTPGNINMFLRLAGLQDDPLSGVSNYGLASMALSATSPDRANFVAASKVSLVGGQRYEHFVAFNGTAAGKIATLSNPRLLALRVTGGTFAGDGKTVEQTTASTSYVDVTGGDLGANLPAGDYLIVATWAATNSSTSNRFDVVLEQTAGGIVLTNHVGKPNTVGDYIPAGFFGVVTLGATNRVRLRFKATATTAKISNVFVAAIPIANVPAIAAALQSQDLSTNYSQSATTNANFTAATSGSVTLQAGRHIEIVSGSFGGDNPVKARPVYDAAGSGLGNHNIPPFGVASTDYHPTFWFIRNARAAGPTTNSITMVRNTAVTTLLRARDFVFSWLREQPDFVALPYEPIAVVADVELGGQSQKSWNSTTTTRRYVHRGSGAYSRVRVNSQEYTRVYSLGAVADGTWFWDTAAMNLYVQLTTAHAAIGSGTPADVGINVIVVPLLLAGRQKHNLIDSLGVRWPYRPLIKTVPKVTQSIRSDAAKFAASASLGSLIIASAHGEFDDAMFRSSFDSYRVKVRRGFLRKSDRLDDFEAIADTTIRKIGTDFDTLSLQLLDRRRVLQAPVSTTTITVKESYGTNARSRDDQEVPVVWGPTLGLKAYRTTANEAGGATYNVYQFAAHGVKGVAAVYLDSARSKRVTADTSSTYTNNGQVRMLNSQLGATPLDTQPPDTIWVDLVGGRTSDGTSAGTAIQTLGAIARDLLVAYGATPATRLLERTFRMIDRRWRWQQLAAGGGRRPSPPVISFLVSGKTTVEEALTNLCAQTVAYWFVNHQDRIGLDTPDFDRGNQARNGGFEDDATSVYPWRVVSNGTIILTIARKYAGTRSAEISNGSTPDALACAAESIVLPAGGTHVVTLVASLLQGTGDSFCIGVVGPSGVETLSDLQVINTGKWSRHSVVYDSEPGDAGFTELRIYPAYGSTTATRVAVDQVEVYRVACVADSGNSTPIAVDFEDEHYYECEVPYAVNYEDAAHASRRRIGESEARLLSPAIEPEGKFAVQSSTRAELADTHAADGESAAGLGAPVPLYYSRPRPILTIDIAGLERIPLVGDYVYHRNNPRIPESTDGYPIWRISKVETNDNTANIVRLEIKRQLDPVIDRIDISPDTVPMGGIALTRSPNAITDFTESTDMQGQFALAHTKPDSVTQRGNYTHKHSQTHLHTVPSHQHNATPASHGIDKALGPYPAEYVGDFHYPGGAITGTPTAGTRGLTDGGHSHAVPGSALAVAAASGTSSAPNTTVETSPGPVSPSFRRARFMQRTAAATTTIDQNLIVGLRSSSIPAGWQRVVELDDWFIRGATSGGPLSTTTTATFVPTDTGSTLSLTSGTGATLGRRLAVTKSGSTVHVIITVASGATPTVVPLHETSDVANASFPSGSGATVTADSQVVVRTSVATSTYTPNDAGSTLKVLSATGIAIGSLLSVINTTDSNKVVHVLVTAVSGLNLTVTPLHLAGDQANSYTFSVATTNIVIDSETIAPTHKHGGLMASHTHAAGGHVHGAGAADFYLGYANLTIQAQRFDYGSDSLGVAAPSEHVHRVRIPLPAEGGNSSSAGGSVTGDLTPAPPFYELVFIQPSDGLQTTLPAGAILFWLQSDTPPQGYAMLGEAKNLLVKGAPAGAGPGAGAGGHVHQQADTAHTLSHAHGATVIVDSDSSDQIGAIIAENNTAAVAAVAAGSDHLEGSIYVGGHGHALTSSVSSTDPGLSANSAHDTGAADTSLPACKRIMLIEKS